MPLLQWARESLSKLQTLDSDARIFALEEKLLCKSGQLKEAEDEIALLRATIKDRDSHVAQLSFQVAKV